MEKGIEPTPLSDNGGRKVSSTLLNSVVDETVATANHILRSLIQKEQYVGESWAVDYDEIIIQVHDTYRKDAGGIPLGCFLIATRLDPSSDIKNWNDEDAAVILLRVKGAKPLWNESETEKIRIEAGQRASGDPVHWHAEEIMDAYTHQAFAWAGIRCSVLGTYYLKRDPNGKHDADLVLTFGSDLSNFYPNKGLKIYKPTSDALQAIVNHYDPKRMEDHPLAQHRVPIGRIRYTSVDRGEKGIDTVRVFFAPLDLLGQKTALFGMTRVGKSNTTKTIAKAVFELRKEHANTGPRVGQLVFDVNGEYANENFQDATGAELPTALRNVWKLGGVEDDVVIYGQHVPMHDPSRKITKINFYDTGDMLNVGKRLIHSVLENQPNPAQYVRSFVATEFENPGGGFGGPQTRFKRNVLAYHALLYRGGFELPNNYKPSPKGLFGDILNVMALLKRIKDYTPRNDGKDDERLQAMRAQISSDELKGDTPEKYARAAATFSNQNPTWSEISTAFDALNDFLQTKTYRLFNDTYAASGSGSDWHDPLLQSILGMFRFGAYKIIKEATPWHAPDATTDYVEDIYAALEAGKLVIVDQSLGDPELNAQMAERIVDRIFRGNAKKFSTGTKAIDMSLLVYIEEAHNLLPDAKEKDVKNIWSRIVKEGGKFGIGVVYATQEPSSIQGNILKNTANWFVGHLASTEETRQVNKSYDFADFEKSILHAQDRGFMRVKTLSNSFVIPVQIDKFSV